MMRHLNDAGTEAICSELDVSAKHLAVILHRARSRLHTALAPHGLGTRAALPTHG